MRGSVKFDPHDIWLGIFWRRSLSIDSLRISEISFAPLSKGAVVSGPDGFFSLGLEATPEHLRWIQAMVNGGLSIGGVVEKSRRVFDIYICVIPMFPIHLQWERAA
jgi:hypothetical protein